MLANWSPFITRPTEPHPLDSVIDTELVPNPNADLLRVHFDDRERPLHIMYSAEDSADFERIVGALRRRVQLG